MKKKIDNNNLLPYFTDDHRDLPADYLKSCEEFFNKEHNRRERCKKQSQYQKQLKE